MTPPPQLRLQLRLRSLSMLFFVLCMCVYTFSGLRSCASFLLSFLGYLPIQLVSPAGKPRGVVLLSPVFLHRS